MSTDEPSFTSEGQRSIRRSHQSQERRGFTSEQRLQAAAIIVRDAIEEILRERALDGIACARCGEESRPMLPVGMGPRGQLFECTRHHHVVTVERQGGYAARCQLDDGTQCGITFGGFRTRTDARAALAHEKALATAATASEGEIPTRGTN